MKKFNWMIRAGGFCLLWAAVAVALPAQTTTGAPPSAKLNSFYSFDGTDGFGPGGLVQDMNGDFYGTTAGGGANSNRLCGYGECGIVFKMTPRGKLSTIYNFCAEPNCTDGAEPVAGVVQNTNGDYYGTTYFGGANDFGVIFKLTPNGKLTVLHSFTGGPDGDQAWAGLVRGTNGKFYGTTTGAGAYNGGTVYTITPNGSLTTLYSFCHYNSCTDGESPYAALIQATDGNFYGTTYYGGANSCGARRCGTIFKITPGGRLTTLHSFDGTDGSGPYAGLIQATDGNFYGTTNAGGINNGGTVFKITSSGTLTTLYSFTGSGFGLYSGLIQGMDGNLYGTAEYGGANGYGSVYKITPGGTLTTLYSFYCIVDSGCPTGAFPDSALVQVANGKFYGTTPTGGTGNPCDGCGTVFRLSVDLK